MEVHDPKDKVFLITGAASGLGAGMAIAFVEQGAKHVAILDLAVKRGEALEKDLNSKHGANRVKFHKCDVTNDEELYNAYDKTVASQGYIDVVINNAGIMNDSEKTYRKEIAINFTAVVTSSFKALSLMRKDEGGRGGTIINIASIAALTRTILLPVYFGTKSAVLQFSNCLGLGPNYQRTGVRVVAVCFGSTDTPLFQPINVGSYDQFCDEMVRNHQLMKEMAFFQKPESAVNGLLQAYKHGESGTTWLAACDETPVDITPDVTEAYNALSREYNNCKDKAQARLK